MALTHEHVRDVCCIWQGSKICRYLNEKNDDKGNVVDVCEKLSPQRKLIDEDVKDFIDQCQKDGKDPFDSGVPLGNGCSGYLNLTNKKQGYNVP